MECNFSSIRCHILGDIWGNNWCACSPLTCQVSGGARLRSSIGGVCNVKVSLSMKHLAQLTSFKCCLFYTAPEEQEGKMEIPDYDAINLLSVFIRAGKGLIYADIIANMLRRVKHLKNLRL